MLAKKLQIKQNDNDALKSELYRYIGEGYKAMQEGRESSVESVRKKIAKRRIECG